MHLKTSVLV